MVSATSPDGHLTAITDDEHGGVRLFADYTAASPKPDFVRFFRNDTTTVRSGDPAIAAGGWAAAYDHEAPLGVLSRWTVVPIFRQPLNTAWTTADGLYEGPASTSVAVTTGEPTGLVSSWLKPILAPGLSMALRLMSPAPTFDFELQTGLSTVWNSAYPAGSYGVQAPAPRAFVFRTVSIAQRDQLVDQVVAAGPLLVQVRSSSGIRDFYGLPVSVSEAYAGLEVEPKRNITISLQPISRPPTIDSPLVVPGHSYDETGASAETYADSLATWATYSEVLMGPVPPVDSITPGSGGTGGTI